MRMTMEQITTDPAREGSVIAKKQQEEIRMHRRWNRDKTINSEAARQPKGRRKAEKTRSNEGTKDAIERRKRHGKEWHKTRHIQNMRQ
ncbi:7665_t:CDS:2 [Rhizophagus irregularis]|nr:7665_t:CDS:2 [Rhizophagus irregularis]